jgi:small subunit ribosomal protein S6
VVAYEILLMLDAELPEQRQEEILTRARELIERGGGKWVGHDVWGRRRLAYEINHKGEGSYHLVNFDAGPETLDRRRHAPPRRAPDRRLLSRTASA